MAAGRQDRGLLLKLQLHTVTYFGNLHQAKHSKMVLVLSSSSSTSCDYDGDDRSRLRDYHRLRQAEEAAAAAFKSPLNRISPTARFMKKPEGINLASSLHGPWPDNQTVLKLCFSLSPYDTTTRVH